MHEQINHEASKEHANQLKHRNITINLISEIVNLLERLAKLKNDLFKDYVSSKLTKDTITTLNKLVSGPSFKNQEYLGKWRKLHKNLNFFIIQDLSNLSSVTEERASKIDIFCLSVKLIKSILK